MNRLIIPILLTISLALFYSGCASSKFTRAAGRYEQAEMFQLAVDQYLLSLNRKHIGNDRAMIGLMRASKRYADELEDRIRDAYAALNDDQVVRIFREIKQLQEKAARFKVDIDISQQTIGRFNESSTRHLRNTYTRAVELKEREKFTEANALFQEVIKIDRGYERALEFYQYTLSEPLYRLGIQLMQSFNYRSAYNTFTRLVGINQQYKDVLLLQKEALYNAILTIAVQPFVNSNQHPFLASEIETALRLEFGRNKNPFLRFVSLNHLQEMINEQRRALANNIPFDAGLILPVRVFLTGNIVNSQYTVAPIKTFERKAYLRYRDSNREIQYRKVTYNEYELSCRASFIFQYEFVRVNDAVMLVFDKVEQQYSDQVRFARSEHDYKQLLPGDWGEGRKDTMYTDQSRINAVVAMFEARQTLRDKREFETQFARDLAPLLLQKISLYDPEK